MNPERRPVGEGRYLLHYERVTSTQDVARALYKNGDLAIMGVRADYQECGRGRSGAAWIAPAGQCLLVSYLLPLPDVTIAPKLGILAAVAVAESLERECSVRPELKWPNDVLINGRKTAGILVETAWRSTGEQAALIGIGVNLNIESFPADLERRSTSVRIEGRRETDIEQFEDALRQNLFHRANELAQNGFRAILREWRARDVSTRYTYRDNIRGSVVEGTYIGISESGCALIRLARGEIHETVSATNVG